jgi:hypothetical protein
MRWLVLACVVACAPHVDDPVEQQRARDRADATVLEHELVSMTGARAAHVTLARSTVDAFTGARTSATAGAVVLVDTHANIDAVTRTATAMLHGIVPDAEPAIAVQLVAPPAAHARPRGAAVLAGAFGLIAILAGWIAWRERHRVIVRP